MFHHKLLRRLLALICALALCLGLSGLSPRRETSTSPWSTTV